MLFINEIVATQKIDELKELFQEHRQELATGEEYMTVKIKDDVYKLMEDKGVMFSLALYDDDKIVGYSIAVMYHNLHSADLLMSQADVLFVQQKYRKTKWGLKLIQETERMSKERGAKVIIWHGQPDTPFSNLMPRIGYKLQNVMFSKVL
jgi:predicted GNAT superfamily acetyltransferase